MLLTVELVGVADLVRLFRVSKTRVEQFTAEDGFPTPHRVGAQGVRVWEKHAVIEWAASRSRPREVYPDLDTPPEGIGV